MTAITAPAAPVLAGRWEVDPAHTTVEFRVRHAGLAKVRGVFREVEGALEIGPDGTLTGRGSVATASLDTRLDARDAHLRSPDFFDAERHPTIRLATADVAVGAGGRVTVAAEITIRGITRTLALEGVLLGTGRDDEGARRIGLELGGHLDRRDFGLTWNATIDGGGLLVGNRVDLHMEISAVRTAASAA